MKYTLMDSFWKKDKDEHGGILNTGRWVPSPKPEQYEAPDWPAFVEDMAILATIEQEEKAKAPLVSPAYYDGEIYRRNDNVSGWSFLAFDIDIAPANQTLEAFMKTWEGLNWVAYTTPSCSWEKPKYRIFFQIDRDIQPDEMNRVWAGGWEWIGRISDAQCKDKSRGYYVPGRYPSERSEFLACWWGEPLPVVQIAELAPKQVTHKPSKLLQIRARLRASVLTDWSKLVRPEWRDEYLGSLGVDGTRYRGIYTFMLRVAGRAVNMGWEPDPCEVARLARELDMMGDGRWHRAGRAFETEAQRACDHVKGVN